MRKIGINGEILLLPYVSHGTKTIEGGRGVVTTGIPLVTIISLR